MPYDYPFDQEARDKASEEWGANCGPCALAFVARKHIESIRGVIPGFDEKRYTSPTMMMQGCIALGLKYLRLEQHFHLQGKDLDLKTSLNDSLHLVRIQWTGPWTAKDANPRWAYNYTHWIAAWMDVLTPTVFDCNGGIRTLESWEKEIVPALTGQNPRADGGHYATHVWRIQD